uniref:Uncharacterized protein n=1 Tax=Triticum urartu TaxID=4572 RepID=A0A8R7PPA4_TRIUA
MDLGLALVSLQPTNSGPILLTLVAPSIFRYFKFDSCPIGGRYTQVLQFTSFKCFSEDKWVVPSQVGYVQPIFCKHVKCAFPQD